MIDIEKRPKCFGVLYKHKNYGPKKAVRYLAANFKSINKEAGYVDFKDTYLRFALTEYGLLNEASLNDDITEKDFDSLKECPLKCSTIRAKLDCITVQCRFCNCDIMPYNSYENDEFIILSGICKETFKFFNLSDLNLDSFGINYNYFSSRVFVRTGATLTSYPVYMTLFMIVKALCDSNFEINRNTVEEYVLKYILPDGFNFIDRGRVDDNNKKNALRGGIYYDERTHIVAAHTSTIMSCIDNIFNGCFNLETIKEAIGKLRTRKDILESERNPLLSKIFMPQNVIQNIGVNPQVINQKKDTTILNLYEDMVHAEDKNEKSQEDKSTKDTANIIDNEAKREFYDVAGTIKKSFEGDAVSPQQDVTDAVSLEGNTGLPVNTECKSVLEAEALGEGIGLFKDIDITNVGVTEISTEDEYYSAYKEAFIGSVCSMQFFDNPKQILIVSVPFKNVCKAFLISADKIKERLIAMFVDSSFLKVVDSIVPFGKILSPYVFCVKDIFEVSTVKKFFDRDFIYYDLHMGTANNYEVQPTFNTSNKDNYLSKSLKMISDYYSYKEKKNSMCRKEPYVLMLNECFVDKTNNEGKPSGLPFDLCKLFPAYKEMFNISLLLSNSYNTILKGMPDGYKTLELRLAYKNNILLNREYKSLSNAMGIPSTKTWLIEKILSSLINVQIVQRGGVLLSDYRDDSIVFACENNMYPMLFETIEKLSIVVQKVMLDSTITPNVELI